MQSHIVNVVIKLIRVGECKGQKTTNSVKSFVILFFFFFIILSISLLTTDLAGADWMIRTPDVLQKLQTEACTLWECVHILEARLFMEQV